MKDLLHALHGHNDGLLSCALRYAHLGNVPDLVRGPLRDLLSTTIVTEEADDDTTFFSKGTECLMQLALWARVQSEPASVADR